MSFNYVIGTNPRITKEQILRKVNNKKIIKKTAQFLLPVYLIEVELEFNLYFKLSKRRGIWALDVVNNDLSIFKKETQFENISINDQIVIESNMSSKESEEFVESATLGEKLSFLVKPKYIKAKHKKTIYHPYWVLKLLNSKKVTEFDAYDAVTGEKHFLFKEKISSKYH